MHSSLLCNSQKQLMYICYRAHRRVQNCAITRYILFVVRKLHTCRYATQQTVCFCPRSAPSSSCTFSPSIAGDKTQVGLYFAPQNDNGKISENEAEWVKADSSSFFKNTHTYLELILPATLESGKSYFIVIRTASGHGNVINKTVKEMIYDTHVKAN